MSKRISRVVVRRLPRYYRYLSELLQSDMVRISSKELSERLGVTASQIRQDLNCFGGFGQQGYGYNIELLRDAIGDILGLNKSLKTIIIGAGNLGLALCNYTGFEKYGFKLVGVFDNNVNKIGQTINELTIQNTTSLEQSFQELLPDIAMLCVPKEHALCVAKQLAQLGIKGIWNFSSADLAQLSSQYRVAIENAHLSESLMILAYQLGDAVLL